LEGILHCEELVGVAHRRRCELPCH